MKTSDIPTISILKACELFHKDFDANKKNKAPWEILLGQYPSAPLKVIYSAMGRDYDKGYIDYGTSLRCAWVTEKGKEFLKINYESI